MELYVTCMCIITGTAIWKEQVVGQGLDTWVTFVGIRYVGVLKERAP